MNPIILVVGATGTLGGNVTRRLLAKGHAVRVMVRNPSRFNLPGVEVVQGDLRDPASLRAAVQGVSQLLTTANSFMGRGATSPTKVDVPGYRALVAAAREAGVTRIVHVSAYGLSADNPVDYFRVKYQVDEVIRAGGVPWVLLKPSAFMDIWVDVVGGGIAKNGTATVFGDGSKVSNYIAVDDVAEYLVRILERLDVRNEVIDVGGPSTISAVAFAELIGKQLGRPVKIKHVPLAVLKLLPPLIRPFNEVAARLMTMGHWSARLDRPLDHWRVAAERFGVAP
ncbi:MAG TPA: NAD(P)H-binding protein, partial [Gemmatimonadales bacterium]